MTLREMVRSSLARKGFEMTDTDFMSASMDDLIYILQAAIKEEEAD